MSSRYQFIYIVRKKSRSEFNFFFPETILLIWISVEHFMFFFLIEILPLLRDICCLYFYIQGDLLSTLLLCPHLFTLLVAVWIIWINDHSKRTLGYWQIGSRLNDLRLLSSFEMLKEAITQNASVEHIYVLSRKSVRLKKLSCRKIQTP